MTIEPQDVSRVTKTPTGLSTLLTKKEGPEKEATPPVSFSSTTSHVISQSAIGRETLEILKARKGGTEFAKLNEILPFSEYFLSEIPKNPLLIRSSAQRTLDMLLSYGRKPAKKDGRELFEYEFFKNTPHPDDAISGNLVAIDELVNEIARAANDSRRVILLAGPVGTSKTTIIRSIFDGLEEYSKTDAGKMFYLAFDLNGVFDHPAIKELDLDVPQTECEMFEDPINIIPVDVRRGFIDKLNEGMLNQAKADGVVLDYSLKSERKLCPKCQSVYAALEKIYEGDFEKIWQHVKAKRLILDATERKGITFFGAKDEKSHKAKELSHDIDWKKVMRGASEGDPKAIRLIGAVTRANRGGVHFGELLKFPREILLPLLDVAQDRHINVVNTLVGVDTLILASTNIPEVVDLARDRKHEATADRISIVTVRYLDNIDDEAGIYSKGFSKQAKARNIHEAPHTREMAALWAIATRLAEPKGGSIDRIKKAWLYSGKHMTGWTEQQILDMKKDVDDEELELLKGISPRDIQNALEKTLGDVGVTAKDKGSKCVDPFLVIKYIERQLENPISKIDGDQKKDFLALLEQIKKELDKKLQEDVRRAASSDPELTQKVCDLYIENADAYLEGKKVEDPTDGILKDPDEGLMRAIEEKRGISEQRKDEFRQGMVRKIGSLLRKGLEYKVKEDEPMSRAIEDFLLDQHRAAMLPSISRRETASKNQKQKADEIEKELINNYGYCPHCANIAIRRYNAPHNSK